MASKINNILVVAPDFPYPPTYGGAADIWGRILILESMGVEIHLICAPKNKPDDSSLNVVQAHVTSLVLVERKNKVIDLFDKLPLQVKSRKSLKRHAFKEPYDLVLLESEYVGAVLENKTLQYTHLALRVHNNEAKYFSSLYKSSKGISKYYYALEAYKFSKYKKNIERIINNYLFISKDECNAFSENISPNNKLIYHLPPPITEIEKERPLYSKNVLFVGSLFMPNNIEALNWYLEFVHPVLKHIEGYRLLIAGSTKGISNPFLTALALQDNAISYHPDVADLDAVYEMGSIFINPMRHGAGVKIKSIHAIQEGLPVVSTSVGMEGTGLVPDVHLKLADTATEFISAVSLLLQDVNSRRIMADQAQNYLVKHYNHAVILERFFSKLK